jgi:hypothetical protein
MQKTGTVREKSQLLCSLRKFRQSHQAALEPKSAGRGVLRLPGMGLPYILEILRHCLAAGHARSSLRIRTVADFRAQ